MPDRNILDCSDPKTSSFDECYVCNTSHPQTKSAGNAQSPVCPRKTNKRIEMTDLPSAPVTDGPIAVSLTELDADPHGVYRHYRSRTPVLRREDGVFLALRAADVQALITDPRTRQMETELVALRGVTSGA